MEEKNLFGKISNCLKLIPNYLKVEKGLDEKTVWIKSREHEMIYGGDLYTILKICTKYDLRVYVDFFDGKIVIYEK